MKSVSRILISSLLLVILLFSAVFMPVVEAETKDPLGVPKKTLVYLNADRFLPLFGVKASAVSKLKSSNNNVATVSLENLGKDTWIVISGKQAGNATISFSVKYKGKKYSYKCKIYVRQYQSPFKSVKIGTLDLKQYLDNAFVSEAINAHVPIQQTLKNKKLSTYYIVYT